MIFFLFRASLCGIRIYHFISYLVGCRVALDGYGFIKETLITICPLKMALLILVTGGNNSLKVHTVVEICCRSFANGFSSLPAWNVINQWHFCSTGFMLLYWPHFLSLIFPFKVIESWINGKVSDRAHKIGSLTFRCIWRFKSGYLHCAVSSHAILRLITATDFFIRDDLSSPAWMWI